MKLFDYPALYNGASKLTTDSQSLFLRLIKAEYLLLFTAALFAMEWAESPAYYVAYALVLLASLATSFFRNMKKPEQDWYKGRALAESVKTSCWRYCMRAEPFGDGDDARVTRAEFRNHLKAILQANRHIGEKIPPDSSANDQVTVTMEQTRVRSLVERKMIYEEGRIQEQRNWYAKKAGDNKKASLYWTVVAVVVYVVAISLALLRIAHPGWKHWPIEALIVMASSLVGWTQVRRYNELASSYSLTAHEIGLTKSRLIEVDSEKAFSDFVNEAEQAFSREHTQWVARQQSV